MNAWQALASGVPGAPDAAGVRAALERVLARPEFRPPGPTAGERALAWLQSLFRGVSGESGGWVLLALGLAAAGLCGAWLAARWLASRDESRAGPPADQGAGLGDAAGRATLDGERQALELRQLAEEARRRGDLALALRLSFFGLVVLLARRGEMRFRPSWTHREVLERGRLAPQVARQLEPLLARLDAKVFGRAPVEDDDLERLDALWRARLGARSAASGAGSGVRAGGRP